MSTAYGVGCKDIKAGAIGALGVMGTSLTSVGKVFRNTASMIDEDGTDTPFYAEGIRHPFLISHEDAGTILKFTLVDIDPANLVKWIGGTVDSTAWEGASDSFSQELSVEYITLLGKTIQFARVFLYGKITWNLTRTEIAKIEVTGIVMQPEGADTPPRKIIPTPA
ncbi:MAG: hypothetical protein A2W90_14660 [Bacteroidetes bacterium GWF2_42_66]|nr:MAG: hypothetical protein A2W92_16055 [Bacteroidetes bacterium GWA2_42_15]OFX99065.1 MAG: hypothetical protein A2W89_06600 [Bacteroidetes bacterium GWE2_42_39]OFY46766.1 MAG: hypothetical protein A2W90_14660 [Bacteroidetes bacterium GWF2_42_66]HBL73825.1 hypothetical protein [Prolixibacteraceae bacterium]HCR89508.1 hypothetical protein [Prolixibacteraceae bacterium]